jgi:CMP-2-keto-3-deoxyoctulosonic acid synthetase
VAFWKKPFYALSVRAFFLLLNFFSEMRSWLLDFSGHILPFGYISASVYKHIGIYIYKPKAICVPMTYKNGKMAGK